MKRELVGVLEKEPPWAKEQQSLRRFGSKASILKGAVLLDLHLPIVHIWLIYTGDQITEIALRIL